MKLRIRIDVKRKGDVYLVREKLGLADEQEARLVSVAELKRGARIAVVEHGGDELLDRIPRLSELLEDAWLDTALKSAQAVVVNDDDEIRRFLTFYGEPAGYAA